MAQTRRHRGSGPILSDEGRWALQHLTIRFPWFTLHGYTGGSRWRCYAAMLVHELLEFLPWVDAHANRWSARYALGVAPPAVIQTQPVPSITPRRPTPSLLTVARTLPGGLDWRTGIGWRSPACAAGWRWRRCTGDGNNTKPVAPDIQAPQFQPYTVGVSYACDWVLPAEQGDYQADAVAQLDAVTPWQVSRELWGGGTETDNESLLSAADSIGGGPYHPVEALGRALQAYFDCQAHDTGVGEAGAGTGTPVVHVTLPVLVTLMSWNLVAQSGDVYVGPNCVVSPGPGYDLTDGLLIVSGPVEYALGPIVPLDGDEFNSRLNRYEIIVERAAIHRFDPCCVVSAAVTIPDPTESNFP